MSNDTKETVVDWSKLGYEFLNKTDSANKVLGDYDFFINGSRISWYDNDELVATVEINIENGVKWICGVYVSPLYRNNGFATTLLQIAILLGARKLSVSKNNDVAISLYKKVGFKIFDDDADMLYMKV